MPLHFIVALFDELAVVPPSVKALTQSEEMFGAVISHQRLCDCFLGGFDAIIAQSGTPQIGLIEVSGAQVGLVDFFCEISARERSANGE